MNPLIEIKKATSPFVIALLLTCFGLVPLAQAVLPPPDGGYPGGNTAEGQAALLSRTTGTFNAAIGFLSLRGLTTGNYNTGVGAGTLALNNADNNTAVGTAALLFNNSGAGNTATGAFALFSNTQGQFNTANGEFALYSNTIGERNTAIGDAALYRNSEGSRNTAIGNPALLNNTTGADNTAIGAFTLFDNNGARNTATGALALRNNTTGGNNTAHGSSALTNNTTGGANTANGVATLLSNTEGSGNTAVGHGALVLNTTGADNTAIGGASLPNNTSGSHNIGLGDAAGFFVDTADDVICIGDVGQNVSNSCYIGNIFGETSANGISVIVNSANKLGTPTSSRRFKENIKPMDKASEALFSLKPVTFRYKKEIDPASRSQFGLVAEDVERVHPDLVVRDKEGKPYTVRYDQVNAMLLNEFLKEHRKNEEQEATIARLEKQIEALTVGLQKVSAQIEISKFAPQVVLNNQ
jgi:trimeric autotransporter adhesin